MGKADHVPLDQQVGQILERPHQPGIGLLQSALLQVHSVHELEQFRRTGRGFLDAAPGLQVDGDDVALHAGMPPAHRLISPGRRL
jgi:hypothetical protein